MNPLLVFFICFVLLLIIRAPIYICMLGSSILYIALRPELSMITAVTKLMNAPNSFPLLAVPFFIIAAEIMNNGGVTARIFDFSKKIVGHVRGGLAYVNIIASLIFSGITGAALADVGGLGKIEIKAMRDEGYDDEMTLGVTAASSTVGPIIPPSIPFVVYGAMASVSIGGLFVAGIVPGLIISSTLAVYVYIISKKKDYARHKRATFKEVAVSFWKAIPALLFPAIILGGIWGGIFSPTEAALVSVVYGLLLSILVYRSVSLKDIPKMMLTTVRQLGPCIAVVVSAVLFSWVLIYEKIDVRAVEFFLSISTNKNVILLMLNIMFLSLGMFLDVVAAIMLTLPLVKPLVAAIGVHPIHMGVIICLNLMIGLITPPVGESLYMLSAISGRSFEDVVRITRPWLIPLIIALLIITYCEPIVMGLPRLLGFA